MRIEIIPGTEHGVKSIQLEERENLFYDAFLQAAGALTEIINSSNTRGRYPDFYGYPNNLITFCGGRGQGKTSAMLSFSRALEDNTVFARFEDGHFDAIRNARFLVMPAIDPTILEDWQNILTVILSRLFLMVKNHWNSRRTNLPHQGDDRDRRDLITAFQRCIDGVDAVKGSRRETAFDSLEQLEQLGDSSQLKRYFHDLISQVLKLVYEETEAKNGYLVIQLDDTDLQFKQAYAVLEDIRKYLAIPNVVILMATDMEQLRKLVVHHYEAYFLSGQDGTDYSKLQDMANKYLDKLIPSQRTIYLPQFEERCWTDATLTLSYGAYIDEMPFQEGILKYIRKKTGIIFLRPTAYLHNIIPVTFRGLVHLLNFLAAMEDIPEITLQEGLTGSYLKAPSGSTAEQPIEMFERAAQTAGRNLKLFENYFLYEWCVDKLDVEDCKRIQKVGEAAPNQRIRRLLETVYERKVEKSRKEEESEELPGQTDYLKLVSLLEEMQKSAGETDYRFYFAVRTYLTIQLHKLMWRCRSETLDRCRQALAEGIPISELFDYEKLKERLGPRLFKYSPGSGEPNYTRYEFTVNQSIVKPVFDKDPDTGGLLFRNDGSDLVFSAGQIFLGMLCPHGTIAQGVKDFYFAQECCLDIILNWDVQDKIYKEESFFRELQNEQGTIAQLGQRGNLFAGRYERLLGYLGTDEKRNPPGLKVLSERCRASFQEFLKQRIQNPWPRVIFSSPQFLEREIDQIKAALIQAEESMGDRDLELALGNFTKCKRFFTDGYSMYEGLGSGSGLPEEFCCAGKLWKLLLDVTEAYNNQASGGPAIDAKQAQGYVVEFKKYKSKILKQSKILKRRNDNELGGEFQKYISALEKASTPSAKAAEKEDK